MAELPRPLASLRYPPITGAEARFDTPPAVVVRRPAVIPERYSTREKDGTRSLECDEAPRIRVVIDPGMAASRSDASSLGERVILLDGAGTFGPLVDGDRKLFNLDHHSGCERLFTLATCEQALLLVHSGLRLAEDDWTIYANDPDLDTVLGSLVPAQPSPPARAAARGARRAAAAPAPRRRDRCERTRARAAVRPAHARARRRPAPDRRAARARARAEAGGRVDQEGRVRLHDRDAALDRRDGLPVRGLRRLHADRGDLRPRRDRAAPGRGDLPRPLGHLHRGAAPEDPLGRSAQLDRAREPAGPLHAAPRELARRARPRARLHPAEPDRPRRRRPAARQALGRFGRTSAARRGRAARSSRRPR